MNIFISWSGPRSREMAEFLNSWLPNVIQELQPFYSQEILKGEIWLSSIKDALASSDFGLFLVTKQNASSQWLNFEAGAISKNIGEAKVATVLLDESLELSEIGPLSQFQITRVIEDDIVKLLKTINSSVSKPMDDLRLKHVWETWREDFWNNWEVIKNIPYKEGVDSQSFDEKLSQILYLLREVERDTYVTQNQLKKAIVEVNAKKDLDIEIIDPRARGRGRNIKIAQTTLPDGSIILDSRFLNGANFKTWEAYEIASGRSSYKYKNRRNPDSKS